MSRSRPGRHSLFATELRKAIAADGRSMRAIAQEAGVTVYSISPLARGLTRPKYATAVALADALSWKRLASLAAEASASECAVCGQPAISLSGRPRRFCSKACQNTARWRRVRHMTQGNIAVARNRLGVHQRAVAAFCQSCEPLGLCRNDACELRPVSPLPFIPLREVKPGRRLVDPPTIPEGRIVGLGSAA